MIKEHVAKLKGKCITLAVESKSRDDFVALMKEKGVGPYIVHKTKEVEIEYRGAPVVKAVSSIMEHFTAMQSMFIRGAAVQLGKLPALFCENDLVESMDLGETTVADETVADNKAARTALQQFVDDPMRVSNEQIRGILAKKQNALAQLDAKFHLDASFWMGMTGPQANQRVFDRINKLLPPLTAPVTTDVDTCVAKLKELQTSKLLQFVGATCTAHVNTVTSWVSSISNGRSPKFESSLPECLANVKSRIERFLKADKDGAEVYSREAADVIYVALEAKFAAKAEVAYKDLSVLLAYEWLLDGARQAKLREWEASCAKSTCLQVNAVAKAPASKRARKAVSAKALVADLLA